MGRKHGITMTMMVITIILLIILAGTITISSYSTINYTRLSTWANEMIYIQDVVSEEVNSSSATEYVNGTIAVNVENLTQEQLEEQFKGETIGADNVVTLSILDLGKLKITNTTYGNLDTATDVYAMSNETGRVYYVQGFETDGTVYYTLTDSLKRRFDLNSSENNLSSIVFVPSAIGYTNQPITVMVKVPNTYTNIVISTSNDEIQIGSQTVKDTIYEYTVNGNQIAGNYEVTVSYNDGTQTLTSEFTVNGYDISAPVVAPILYENLVYKQTDTAVVDYITNVTATDESGIRIMKYTLGTIGLENAKTYFKDNGNIIANGRINLDRDATAYTIYAEDNAGNFSILSFDKKYLMPEEWKQSISYVEDRVPIPKGFIASPYDGENTKDGGMVIYELTGDETDISKDATQYVSWTTRNQYVWVPVSKELFKTQFVRRFNEYISNKLGSNYWEVVLDTTTNIPLDNQDAQFVSEATLKEVKAMYASVKKYGGFYIARYEAGIDERRITDDGKVEEKVYSMMGKVPYTMVIWGESMANETGGSVEASRNIYPATSTNYSVVSTLIYGVQWDTTLQWWLDTNAVSDVKTSITYGNYKESEIKAGDLNEGARYALYSSGLQDYKDATGLTKDDSTMWSLSTGALKYAKINNIYDMAGNVNERSMEGYSTNVHTYRGGSWYSGSGVNIRTSWSTIDNVGGDYGFRVALYIK